MTRYASLSFALFAVTASATPFEETRYCRPIERNMSGEIIRSMVVRNKFQKLHPCPSTGLRTGTCPDWHIDHVIPLACGGCDSVSNMQWLPVSIKACSGSLCKDRWERRIYCEAEK